jgi:hypothetical protein
MKGKLLIGILIVIIVISVVIGSSFFSKIFSREEEILKSPGSENDKSILFLHHSTGNNIWNGGVRSWFDNYNQQNDSNISIVEQDFPKRNPYGWNNYPYDYWNIWVNHAGDESYKEEPTLEIITKIYDVVILKHCYPVSEIKEDTGNADITSDVKRLENYKLQYQALKDKMKEFNQTKFIFWTIPALTEEETTEAMALRASEFYEWVKDDWDEKGDNIFLWDFYNLETEGSLYLKEEYAESSSNPHPNKTFSKTVAPLFCKRIIDIIDGNGDTSTITGK